MGRSTLRVLLRKGWLQTRSRHPYKTNGNEQKIEAEELWNSWFFFANGTIENDKLGSANQESQVKPNQPREEKLASEMSQLANESERQDSV